jgi:hypothetical protein
MLDSWNTHSLYTRHLKIFLSITTGPEKLKFTWRLSKIVQIKSKPKPPRLVWGHDRENLDENYLKIFSRTTELEKFKFTWKLADIVQQQIC